MTTDLDPLDVLETAARELYSKKHHPNCVGVQFVQIGNDARAKAALHKLTKGNVRVSSFPTPHTLQMSKVRTNLNRVW